MHFRPLLLLGAATTLFLPSLAEFKGAAIRWCNESPPDYQSDKSCTQTVLTLDQCNLIPDSNAKGDWSSSAVVSRDGTMSTMHNHLTSPRLHTAQDANWTKTE